MADAEDVTWEPSEPGEIVASSIPFDPHAEPGEEITVTIGQDGYARLT